MQKFTSKINIGLVALAFSLSLNLFFLQQNQNLMLFVDSFIPPQEGFLEGQMVETARPQTPHKALLQANMQPAGEKDKGFCSYVSPEVSDYKGELIHIIKPETINAGDYFQVKIYVKNTGNVRWFSDYAECNSQKTMRLGTLQTENHASPFWSNLSVPYNSWVENDAHNRLVLLQDYIDPNEIGTFVFWSDSLKEEDIYREVMGLVVGENMGAKQWLIDPKIIVDMIVGNNLPEDYAKKIKPATISVRASQLQGDKNIEVDISEQKLLMKYDDLVINTFLISSGALKTPTPLGTFSILNKQELRVGGAWPHYRMPNFMGFTKQYAGFHALPYLANDGGTFWTEALNHIGRRVSHGCVRVLPWDAATLFEWSEVGVKVQIHE